MYFVYLINSMLLWNRRNKQNRKKNTHTIYLLAIAMHTGVLRSPPILLIFKFGDGQWNRGNILPRETGPLANICLFFCFSRNQSGIVDVTRLSNFSYLYCCVATAYHSWFTCVLYYFNIKSQIISHNRTMMRHSISCAHMYAVHRR